MPMPRQSIGGKRFTFFFRIFYLGSYVNGITKTTVDQTGIWDAILTVLLNYLQKLTRINIS